MTKRPPRKERRLAFDWDTPDEAPPQERKEADAEPDTLSVHDLVARIKATVDDAPGLQRVWVRGEVSNFKAAASGHWYFTLKDEGAQLRCVMWRGRARNVAFDPEDGLEVLVRGSVGVYEVRGDVQFYATDMKPGGDGALALALEQLRRKLSAEGLFEPHRKRPLPFFPRTVGVVTSGTGAVWHDIQRVARRRFPGIHLILCPVKVQGEGAAGEIAAGIELFNEHDAADVLVVGRGGGSLEDLWAFNEELVVRAVADSRIPVVSAVGHETDWTLTDQAADERAPTPSAAAEVCVPNMADVLVALADREKRLARGLENRVKALRERFERVEESRVWEVERLLREPAQRVDDAERGLRQAMERLLERKAAALSERAAVLQSLSPLNVLARGYAVAEDDEGRVLRRAADAAAGDPLRVRLKDGTIRATVNEVNVDDE